MTRQFVVQLENHPGELAHLSRALAARGVNIHHVSCAGAGALACMFVTTDDPSVTRDVLHGLGHEFIEGQPVLVEVEDKPGGLADVTERLAQAGVNVTGMLCVGRRPGFVEITFCVDDDALAREVLGLDSSKLVGVSS